MPFVVDSRSSRFWVSCKCNSVLSVFIAFHADVAVLLLACMSLVSDFRGLSLLSEREHFLLNYTQFFGEAGLNPCSHCLLRAFRTVWDPAFILADLDGTTSGTVKWSWFYFCPIEWWKKIQFNSWLPYCIYIYITHHYYFWWQKQTALSCMWNRDATNDYFPFLINLGIIFSNAWLIIYRDGTFSRLIDKMNLQKLDPTS